MCSLYSILIFLICTFNSALFAEDFQPDWRSAHPVELTEKTKPGLDGSLPSLPAKKVQPFPRLYEVPFDQHSTTVMFPVPKNMPQNHVHGINPENASTIFVLFGGTGAKTSDFGIGASMGPVAQSLLKQGVAPVAFQNPLYFNDFLPDEKRQPTIDKFKSTDAQVKWMVESIQWVVDQIGKDSEGRAKGRIIVGGRSTGAGVLWELTHRYSQGKPEASVMSHVSDVMLTGVLPHTAERVKNWLPAELAYVKKMGIADIPTITVESEIWSQMHWMDPDPKINSLSVKQLPRVHALISANDDYVALEDQIAAIDEFVKSHRQFEVRVTAMDTRHNAASSVVYRPVGATEDVKIGTMKRMTPYLVGILDASKKLHTPGVTVEIHPAFVTVPSVNESILTKIKMMGTGHFSQCLGNELK